MSRKELLADKTGGGYYANWRRSATDALLILVMKSKSETGWIAPARWLFLAREAEPRR